MKPIKDIGQCVQFEGNGGDWADVLDDDTYRCPVIVMTLEQRRELVREVWEAATASEWRNINEHIFAQETVEQFIKDNDL